MKSATAIEVRLEIQLLAVGRPLGALEALAPALVGGHPFAVRLDALAYRHAAAVDRCQLHSGRPFHG